MFLKTLESVLNNQTLFYLLCFFLGVVVCATLLSFFSHRKTWTVVDLIWIVGGGLSLTATIVSSVQLGELVETRRRSTILLSDLRVINADSKAYTVIYCESQNRPDVVPVDLFALNEVCNPIYTFISQSSPESHIVSALETFGTDTLNPYGSLVYQVKSFLPPTGPKATSIPAEGSSEFALPELGDEAHSESNEKIFDNWSDLFETIETEVHFSRRPSPEELQLAYGRLLYTGMDERALIESRDLFSRYDSVEAEFEKLKVEWLSLSSMNALLAVRALAVAFISLIFPLRVGKSLADLGLGRKPI